MDKTQMLENLKTTVGNLNTAFSLRLISWTKVRMWNVSVI